MQVLDFPILESVALPPEADECMPTQKERLDAFDERLNQIEQKLALKPPKPKSVTRQFLEHVWGKIAQHWKITVPTIALSLTVLGWFVNPLYKQHLDHEKDAANRNVDDRVRTVLNEPNGVSQTLHAIQETVNETKAKLDTLAPFIHDLILHQFENASKLPVKALNEQLPAVQHLIAVAQDQKIVIDPLLVRTLGQNLLQEPSSWQTSNQLISYYSTLKAFPLPKSAFVVFKAPDKNQECIVSNDTSQGIHVNGFWFENCTQHLDPILGPDAVRRDLIWWNLVFENVRVIYSGGPIKLDGVYFVNCTFELHPGKSSKQLAETLLASSPGPIHFDFP